MTKVSPWGSLNEDYPNFIAVSRYARWIEDEGRRETWAETVNRYATFMSSKLGDKIDDKTVVELHSAILDQEIMPSMRALMTAGEALERENIAGYNPVSGDTMVLTSEGMKEIRSLSGKSTTVLNKDGRWADAEFRGYGDQDVYNVVLRRKKSGTTQTVVATGNHRWVKTNGDVVSTAELVSGDKIPYSVAPRPGTDNTDYQLGAIHGLVYGDGTSTYSQESLKELPVGETPEYNLGFLRGWIAADGSVAKSSSQVTLCVNSDGLEWFDTYAPTVGILRTGMQQLPDTTNLGERKRAVYSLRLDRASMIADDFIIGCKQDRFIPLDYEVDYAVVSVSPAGKSDVYCAEVPDTNTFVLSNGIVTGNCAFVAVDNVRAFDEALYVLMNGTGLGFNVESAYVSKLPSMPPEFFDTETTIVVHDSKLGWAKAYKELIALLLQGQVPTWDLSRVRPAGAKLKTFGGRACLTGDTIVYKDRKKARGHNEITIADLYDLQNGEGKWKNKPNHFKQVKLRTLSEKDGIFYRNNVLEVIDNGFAPVYEIVTENGYRIKATGNHRFMTSTGDYDFVDNFNVGDLIAVNGSKEKKTGACIDCNTSVSRRSIRCRPCANQNQIGDTALLTTARQRKECRDYLGGACERCGVSETRLTVHHQDKNPYNNDWSNLETMCEPCHQVNHANERSFGDPYSHKYLSFDEIISIEYAGVERVFDLAMEAPDHNFVANGFVSHNSGPQPLINLFDFTVESFKRASGRKLKPIEVHDIMCKIAEVVVVGGVRRCLVSASTLYTLNGITTMGDVQVGDTIVSGGRKAKVIEKVDSGKQQTVIVKHQCGQSEMTPNHRIAVFDGIDSYTFKEAGALVPGDRLVWDLAGYDGEIQSLPRPSYQGHFNAKPFVIPDLLDADIAWLIGLVHGDGHIHAKGIEIAGHEGEWATLERANAIFADKFGVAGKVSRDSHEGRGIRLRVNSTGLALWFAENIKNPNVSIRVPSFVMNSQRDTRAAYLAGVLDSDGSVRHDNILEQATSIYPEFVEDLRLINLSLGIATTTHSLSAQRRRDNGENAKDYQTLHINGKTSRRKYLELVQPYSEKLAGIELSDKNAPHDFTYPAEWGLLRKSRNTQRTALIEKGLLDADYPFAPVEVLSVELGSTQQTWDIEVEDIHEFTADGLVTHNSALISMSDLDDFDMSQAKSGQWWEHNGQRALANNSAVYYDKPSVGQFFTEWSNLYESKSGERGLINMGGIRKHVASFERRDASKIVGKNPCSEINLRSSQFCNLTEVVIDPNDTLFDIRRKVEMATILGTYQATLTDFKYLRPVWKKNTEEERLLGVSLTGIYGHKFMSGQETYGGVTLPEFLRELYDLTVQVNTEWSEKFGIPASAALTTVKPSGTVSQLVGASSGIHPWYAPYYVRTVRGDNKDPLTQFLKAQGVPNEPDVTKPDDTTVFSFPVKAPSGVITSRDLSAIDHLKLYCVYRENWTDHDVSVTINVREEEWPSVGAWVYDNFDRVGGVSFLPFSDHTYKQAPYQAISEDEYNVALSNMPTRIDWVDLPLYELEDSTAGNQTLACSGSSCEIVDITK